MLKTAFRAAVFALMATCAHATQEPVPGKLDGRVRTVVYQANNVVRIDATYGISTMLLFDADEHFETIALGDTESWQVTPNERKNLLFIKPVARNVVTNVNVVTNKRIYFLELHDFAPSAGKAVYGVRFVFPDQELNASLKKEAEYRAANPNISSIDKANMNIDYSFSGAGHLKPLMVFDDGKKTFFKFSGRVPAIFAVNSDFSETLRNFRREGEYIVVDGVATQYSLRDGNEWICIFNLRRPDFGAPDQSITGPALDNKAEIRTRSGNK